MNARLSPVSGDAIGRRPLHDEVAARLRDLITRGELSPGERLNERVLTERFGISRTPLREAIKVLSSEGLVELLPNRGAAVTRITRADAEDMFQVMAVLEALAGELACQRATEDDIAEVRALHYQMRAHHARGELAEYFQLNQRIHEKIIDCARNAALTGVYRGLSGRIRRARYMANLSRERWDHAVEEHEQILAALTRRDGEQLKALLRRHLENKLDVICASLTDAGGAVAARAAG
ncbi:MAG TPA: GntR family transcriptional regulator [Pelomicrobium sp.]|nr:GntR family transcriptional regulator [Pelomicrobium sp.]